MTNANNTTKNGNTYGTKRGGRRGFTLIEILIVVVILGVLAALVIPGVTSALSDSQHKAAVARASQLTTMLTRYNQFYAKDNNVSQIGTSWKDGDAVSVTALQPLADDAKYCNTTDLQNPEEGKGWVWKKAAGENYGKIYPAD